MGTLLLLLATAQDVDGLGHDDAFVREETERRLRGLAFELEDAAALVARPGDGARRRRIAHLLADLVRPCEEPRRLPEPERRPKAAGLDEDCTPEDREIQRTLRTRRVSLEAKAAPLTDVVDQIRELSGLNLHLSGIEAPEKRNVEVSATNVTVRSLLRTVVEPDLAYVVKDGVVVIAPKATILRRIRLHLYDVQSLELDPEKLAERIEREVLPESWCEADGKAIQHQNGLLIVRQSEQVHAGIRTFLARLREKEPDRPARPEPSRKFRALEEGTEREVAALADRFRAAIGALERALKSDDVELRSRAGRVRGELLAAARRLELPFDPQRGMQKVRAAFLAGDVDDEEATIRAAFAPRLVVEVGYFPSDDPAAPRLEPGKAEVWLQDGRPAASPDEADEGIFLVPEGADVPSTVRVKFARD